jgi:branched-chain amino acid transport system substrate-binding protein
VSRAARILVVDDNEDNRYTLTERLRREGYRDLATAGDGAEALTRLVAEPFDLVLLDVMMPVLDGIDTLARLKAGERLRDVPVVMISAVGEIERVARCIELGAEDYLPKPFDKVILRARVAASLERKRLRDAERAHLVEIEAQRRQLDAALRAILPAPAVAELQATGRIAPRRFEDVAVLLADLNAAGGVLGEAVRAVGVDDFCDPDQGRAAARKLVSDGVVAVIGHQCSGAAIAAALVYGEAGVVLVSNAATNPRLTEQGIATVFRVAGRDDQQGAMAAAYLAAAWRGRAIALVHDGQAYGRGLAEEVGKGLQRQGVGVALLTTIEPGRTDYGTLVEALREHGIEVLHYSGYAPEAGLIVRQARAAGLDLQLVCGDGTSSEDFSLIAGAAGEGTLLTDLANPADRPEASGVAARLRARGTRLLPAAFYGYAAVQAWAQAAQAAGSRNGRTVAAVLHDGRRFATILGRLGFDAKGDVTGIETFGWYRWRHGELVSEEIADAPNQPGR